MVRQIQILPARELVASELRKLILTRQFKAGEELKQDKIAEMFGVSRMPVREAIRILANEGLLKTSPNRSAVVTDIPEDFIKEHFEVRILLECEATARACTRFKSLDELISIHEKHRQAIKSGDIEQVKALNQSFHIMIWDAAENTKMKTFLKQLWNGLFPVTATSSLTHTDEEHEVIMQAFKEKNPEKARKAMKTHLESSMENILKSQKNNMKD